MNTYLRTVGLIALLAGTTSVRAECTSVTSSQLELSAPFSGAVTVRFGMSQHPVLGTTRLHAGIDYAAPVGDPVRSAAAGTVISAAYKGEFGNRVEIDHGNGYATSYSHLARFAPSVKRGDCVAAGTVIGQVGATGLVAGPHLHFEVSRDGEPIDPVPLLQK